MYYEEHCGPPMTRLPNSLQRYVEDEDVFICPNDAGSTDSYSAFFAGRYEMPDSGQFVVGCPRHRGEMRSAVLWGGADSEVDALGKVVHVGDQESPAPLGEMVEGGALHFADGSTVQMVGDTRVAVLTSVFSGHILHTVIWMPGGQDNGEIEVEVTPGSDFEVITPIVIAGVRGTRFRVRLYRERTDGEHREMARVDVLEGEVVVESRLKASKVVLRAGESTVLRSDVVFGTATGLGPWQGRGG